MGRLCGLAPAFGLSSIVRFAIRKSVGSVRSAPRVFSDGLRRCGSSRFRDCLLSRRPFHGGKSSRRFAGRSCGFARTWASRAGGSVSFNSHVWIRRGDRGHPLPSGVRAGEVQFATPPAEGDAAHGPFGGVVGATDAAVVDGDRRAKPSTQIGRSCHATEKLPDHGDIII